MAWLSGAVVMVMATAFDDKGRRCGPTRGSWED